MIELSCGFCCKPLPLPRQPAALAALAGQVHLCRHCGAAYTLVGDGAQARGALGAALRVAGHCLQLSSSPCVVEFDGRRLYLVCAWDPGEGLSTMRAAHILDLHRATVQQHVREGRFPGAVLGVGLARGRRGSWSIPRQSLQLYLYGKGKAEELRPGARVKARA